MKKNYSPATNRPIRTIHFKSVFICILTFLFLVAPSLKAQETVVVGQVLNSSDKSPVPNVNITFKNSLTVAQSNEEGYFIIRNTGKQNTLIFT